MTIERRLREERERCGLSQPRLGEIAGVVKQTVIQWEKGASSPNAVQLLALGDAGLDVQYILTGRRTMQASENRAGYVVEPLRPDEAALLDNYRHSTPEAQAAIRATGAALAEYKTQVKAKPGKG